MSSFEIEAELLEQNYRCICGVDEVGRGALFGPVVAGAVVLDPGNLDFRLKDSKQLSHRQRLRLSGFIYENATAYSIGWCWNDEIDELNILEATKKAMNMAVKGLQAAPDYALVDGIEPDFLDIPGRGIIKGDRKSLSIAAASIIAKVFRDQLLVSFSRFFPGYLFENNKGYPTRAHRQALSVKGQTQFHRKSFRAA